MTNVLSKMNEDETAVIQIIIRPKGPHWRKKAENMGTELFKGDQGKQSFLKKIPVIGWIYALITVLFFGYDQQRLGGTNAPGAQSGDRYVRMLQTKEEVAKHVGEKAQQEGFDCAIRLFVTAKNGMRAISIVNDIVVGLNLFKHSAMNWFQTRRIFPINAINTPLMLHNFKYR